MRAAVYAGTDASVVIEEVVALEPGPHDVVVRVTATGVCHSDLSMVTGGLPWPVPTIVGHEACGIVDWVGDAVERIKPGDRVVSVPYPMCGTCWYCSVGEPNHCALLSQVMKQRRVTRPDGADIAAMAGLGTFAESMTVHEASLIPVTTDLPDSELALIGCGVTTGLGASLNSAVVTPGSSVVVVGCGAVGLAAVQGARIAGATRIVAVDPVAARRAAAGDAGATDVVDPLATDPVKAVRALTGGRGAEFCIEAVGRADTVRTAFDAARPGGRVVIVGYPPSGTEFTWDAHDFLAGQRVVSGTGLGSGNVRRDIPKYIRMAETGQLNLESLVSCTVGLDDVNKALLALERGEAIRSVIIP